MSVPGEPEEVEDNALIVKRATKDDAPEPVRYSICAALSRMIIAAAKGVAGGPALLLAFIMAVVPERTKHAYEQVAHCDADMGDLELELDDLDGSHPDDLPLDEFDFDNLPIVGNEGEGMNPPIKDRVLYRARKLYNQVPTIPGREPNQFDSTGRQEY
ncbi:Uncharacterized protein PBTT_05827, partial [Plasmodiophora brassicae]